MTTTGTATKCTACNGEATITEYDEDGTATTFDCDDCDGRGEVEPITEQELAEQIRQFEATREADRANHLEHIPYFCSDRHCPWQ